MGVRSITVEGERGSIRSVTRRFLIAGSGFVGDASLLSLEPIVLSGSRETGT